MKKETIQRIIRIIIGIIFSFLVFKEAGVFTAIFCLLVLVYTEIDSWALLKIIKEIEEIKKSL